MAKLNDEALSWLLGEYESAELVAWADGWIERLDVWPDELTEISLEGRHRSASILPLLQALAIGGDEIEAVAFFLEREYEKFREDKDPFKLVGNLFPLTWLENERIAQLSEAVYKLDMAVDMLGVYYGENWLGEASEEEMIQAIHKELGALPAPFTFKP